MDSHGAELISLQYNNEEILYQKTENFWQRQSPVLFPIVGGLKNGVYQWERKDFILSQHGFARDEEFILLEKIDSKAIFELNSNEKTKSKFPFDWRLHIIYEIKNESLEVTYTVTNTGNF